MPEIYLIRHGDTEWSLRGKHTGLSDIPLTEHGRQQARLLREELVTTNFQLVLTSPLRRARETCELAGLGQRAGIDPDLMEWNYGDYEGLTSDQIHADRPAWTIFNDGGGPKQRPRRVWTQQQSRPGLVDPRIFGGYSRTAKQRRGLRLRIQGRSSHAQHSLRVMSDMHSAQQSSRALRALSVLQIHVERNTCHLPAMDLHGDLTDADITTITHCVLRVEAKPERTARAAGRPTVLGECTSRRATDT